MEVKLGMSQAPSGFTLPPVRDITQNDSLSKSLELITTEDDTSPHNQGHKLESLAAWCSYTIQSVSTSIPISSFEAGSWSSGLAFCALIFAHKPECIISLLNDGNPQFKPGFEILLKNPNEKNLRIAFTAAHSLGVPDGVLDYQEFLDTNAPPDTFKIITYIIQLYHYLTIPNDKILTSPRTSLSRKTSSSNFEKKDARTEWSRKLKTMQDLRIQQRETYERTVTSTPTQPKSQVVSSNAIKPSAVRSPSAPVLTAKPLTSAHPAPSNIALKPKPPSPHQNASKSPEPAAPTTVTPKDEKPQPVAPKEVASTPKEEKPQPQAVPTKTPVRADSKPRIVVPTKESEPRPSVAQLRNSITNAAAAAEPKGLIRAESKPRIAIPASKSADSKPNEDPLKETVVPAVKPQRPPRQFDTKPAETPKPTEAQPPKETLPKDAPVQKEEVKEVSKEESVKKEDEVKPKVEEEKPISTKVEEEEVVKEEPKEESVKEEPKTDKPEIPASPIPEEPKPLLKPTRRAPEPPKPPAPPPQDAKPRQSIIPEEDKIAEEPQQQPEVKEPEEDKINQEDHMKLIQNKLNEKLDEFKKYDEPAPTGRMPSRHYPQHLRLSVINPDLVNAMNTETPTPQSTPDYNYLYYLARAVQDFTSPEENQLMFKKNDIMEIYERDASGWWLARLNGYVGWVPGDYLVLLEENFFEEEVEDHEHDEEKEVKKDKTNVGKLLDEIDSMKSGKKKTVAPSSPNESDVKPILEGFLQKMGTGMVKKWQKRWFSLRGSRLLYFKDRPHSKRDPPIGFIPIIFASAIEPVIDKNKKPTFQIISADKAHFLMAESLDLMVEWVTTLQAVKATHTQGTQIEHPRTHTVKPLLEQQKSSTVEILVAGNKWKKRWCLIKDGILTEHESKNGKIVNKMPLYGCEIEEHKGKDGKKVKNTLEIKTHQTTLVLKMDSEKDYLEWMNVLKQQKASLQQKLENIEIK